MARIEAPAPESVPVPSSGSRPDIVTIPARRLAYPLLRWLQSRDMREPFVVFAITRALFILLTYFGVILFNSHLHGPNPSFLHALLPAWNNRWDTEWYIDIARRGYAWKKAVGTSPTAFFPLYPLLIRIGVMLTHRSYIVVALAVSNLSFFAALIYLWRLTDWELNAAAARRACLYMAAFPTALFFFAGYTESLFLLLTVASFYHLRHRQWLLAGAFGALASATRVTGVLLLVPLLYEYSRSRNFDWRAAEWRGIIALAAVPLGLLAFMWYLHVAVGDALAFTHYQAGWQKAFTLRLWAGFLESFRQMLVVQPWASFYEAHNVINVTIGLAFLVCTIGAARLLPASYTLYLAAFWLVTLASPAIAGGYPVPLISLSRYVLSLFPIFMYLGRAGRSRTFNDTYLVLSTGMLAVLTLQFINGGWVV